jgi:hypothetical protein
MNFEERISRLERDNRRWKQMTLLLTILPLAMAILMGAGREEKIDVLTVRELIFKDQAGAVRGRIAADKGIAQQFFASNGKERYRIAVSDTAVVHDIYDSNNILRSRLEVDKKGDVLQAMFDNNNIPRIVTGIVEETNAFYSLHDANDVRFAASLEDDGSVYLTQFDSQKLRYVLGTSSEGDSVQMFLDRKGQMRAATGTSQNNTFKFYVEKGYIEQAKEAVSWLSFMKHLYDASNYLTTNPQNKSGK